MWCGWSRLTAGKETVGGREVLWRIEGRTVVVTHAGTEGAPVSYPVPLATTPTPHAGERLWWLCPACGRRCGLLYLPVGRERLACRKCLGLGYASQHPRLKGKVGRKSSVPVLEETTEVFQWCGGRVTKQSRTRVFGEPG